MLSIIASSLAALAGLPLFLVLALFAIIGFLSEDLPLTIFYAEFLRLASNSTLSAIPLFALGGFILAESNAPKRLLDLAKALLWWLPGSLAIIAVLVMALLTAFTGASGITIVALGGLMFPTLLKGGYSERFSLGLLTTSGSIGLLFPPSLPLILYGVVSEAPIDKLFLAGIVPGTILVAGMSLYSMLFSVRKTSKDNVGHPGVWQSVKAAGWEIPLPVVIIGGIYSGLFTAVEAAVVAVVYVGLVEIVIIRELKISSLPSVIVETSILVGGILLILGSALALTNYFVFADLPTKLLGWMQNVFQNKYLFLFALNVFLLIVGCLMDIFSALVVVVPLIIPLAAHYQIDPIHLGIIFLMNLEIGYSTPPVGLNLFISSFRFNKPITELYKASFSFLLIQLFILALITYIPALTMIPLDWWLK